MHGIACCPMSDMAEVHMMIAESERNTRETIIQLLDQKIDESQARTQDQIESLNEESRQLRELNDTTVARLMQLTVALGRAVEILSTRADGRFDAAAKYMEEQIGEVISDRNRKAVDEVTGIIKHDIYELVRPIRYMPYSSGDVRGAIVHRGYLRQAIRPREDELGSPASNDGEYVGDLQICTRMNQFLCDYLRSGKATPSDKYEVLVKSKVDSFFERKLWEVTCSKVLESEEARFKACIRKCFEDMGVPEVSPIFFRR